MLPKLATNCYLGERLSWIPLNEHTTERESIRTPN
jgi:hypothetical protein